jgi:hypothetical protein
MARDRWEYCYVVTPTGEIRYLDVKGMRKVKGGSRAEAVALLGAEGWELVGLEAQEGFPWFKRRMD